MRDREADWWNILHYLWTRGEEPRSEQGTVSVFVFREESEELNSDMREPRVKLLLHHEKMLPPSGPDVQRDIFFSWECFRNIKVI